MNVFQKIINMFRDQSDLINENALLRKRNKNLYELVRRQDSSLREYYKKEDGRIAARASQAYPGRVIGEQTCPTSATRK